MKYRIRTPLLPLLSLLAVLTAVRLSAAGEYSVSVTGSDANPGTPEAPFRTIQKAADTATSGDTVRVQSGRYPEEITIRNCGVSFVAVGTQPVVVDGGGIRSFGFHAARDASVTDVTIEGFEVTSQTVAAISAERNRHSRFRVRKNRIHHVWEKGIQVGGSGHVIEDNVIYMIGNAQEAMGVFLWQARDSLVRRNQIYLCKKEGIRDFVGRHNRIEDNIVYGCWTGLAFNSSEGDVIASNNYIYSNVMGFNPKHTKGDVGWNCFWHNTVYDSSSWSVGIGINDPPLDYLDIRNNIFSRAGEALVYETPETNGSHLILDGNLYHREGDGPPLLYIARRSTKASSRVEMQEHTPYEKHGREEDPMLIDPARGALDYPDASPAARGGVALDSLRGTQLGARGLKQTTPSFVRLPLKAIAASCNESLMDRTTDNLHHTTWHSGTETTNQWILYNLGAPRTFRFVILVPYGHKVEHNVRRFSFEISDDRQSFTTIVSGTNNDSGSIFIYELSAPVTARYLRFNMKDKFPDDGYTWTLNQLRFADIWVGNLVASGEPQ